jgi:hypothetical protein
LFRIVLSVALIAPSVVRPRPRPWRASSPSPNTLAILVVRRRLNPVGLHPVILRLLGRGNPRYADIASRAERRTSMVITALTEFDHELRSYLGAAVGQ